MFSLLFLSGLVLAQEAADGAAEPAEAVEESQESSSEEGAAEEPLGEQGAAESETVVVDPPQEAAEAPLDEGAIRELEAAALYQIALELVAQGRFGEADSLLVRLQSEFEGTDIESRSSQMLLELERLADAGEEGTHIASGPTSGRLELIVGQGFMLPWVMGVLVPGATFQPDEPLMPVLLGFGGLGMGIAGGIHADNRWDITTPQAMALMEGELLGLANGLLYASVVQSRDYRANYQQLLGGFLVGAGAGAAAGYYLEDLTAGDVSLIHHGGIWGTWFSSLSFAFFDVDDDAGVVQRLVLGADAGAIAGGVLSHYIDISRKRVNMITLSGAAGTFVASGLVALGSYYGNLDTEEAAVSMLAAGSLAGAALGTWFTRDVTGDGVAAHGTLIGLEDGELLIGAPAPTLIPESDGGLAWGLSLARGTF